MSKITPFRAIRPVRDKVHLVATRPIYSYKKNVLKSKLEDNPFTFLHIINPEFGGERTTQPNSHERFELVANEYKNFLKAGILIQDPTPRIYVYRQTTPGNVFTGVIAGASNEEYRSDAIKKHEATLTVRERMFTDYLDIVGYNAEPVLLSYPSNDTIKVELNSITTARPEYEFTTTDRITHELWVLDEDQTVKMEGLFATIPALYIADGHHRTASSVGLEQKRTEDNKAHFPNEKSFLAFMIDEEQLKIEAFNRMVKSLKGMKKVEFLKALENSFLIEKSEPKKMPENEHAFTICIQDDWYRLTCRPEIINTNHPVKSIDAQILTDYLLEPILGIKDLKTDTNIEFVSGIVPIEKIEKSLEKGIYELAIFLYPVTMQQVKVVADNQLIMPPKSTWVEPKLRSGMTIYAINE